jgi:hypothetical protein
MLAGLSGFFTAIDQQLDKPPPTLCGEHPTPFTPKSGVKAVIVKKYGFLAANFLEPAKATPTGCWVKGI